MKCSCLGLAAEIPWVMGQSDAGGDASRLCPGGWLLCMLQVAFLQLWAALTRAFPHPFPHIPLLHPALSRGFCPEPARAWMGAQRVGSGTPQHCPPADTCSDELAKRAGAA